MTNPMIRKFVNNWLWDSGGKRKSSGMEWCNYRIEDVAQMITDFCNEDTNQQPFHCKNCGFDDGVPVLQCPLCNDSVDTPQD